MEELAYKVLNWIDKFEILFAEEKVKKHRHQRDSYLQL